MRKKLLDKREKNILIFICAAVLGLFSIIIPPLLDTGIKHYGGSSLFFGLISTGIENLSSAGLVFLFLSGILLGYLAPKFPWLWGIGTMSLFPVIAFIEGMMNPSTHNLFPIEIIVYGVTMIPGIAGAYVGAYFKRHKEKINW